MRQRRGPAHLGVVALMVSVGAVALAAPRQTRQAGPPNEYQVKAAFLYNFAKFVEWPPQAFTSPTEPIVIGIAGRDPFGDLLVETTRGERVNGRAIEIRHFGARDPVGGCHVLFLGAMERRKLVDVLAQVQGRSVLTVSDAEDFAAIGGVIRLTKDGYRVGLEISLQAAEQANLRISSRLLSLAKLIDPAVRGPRP
jgi:hypothetical protein